MRRVQIYLEEAMDEALVIEAARASKSKAALIRQFVAERLTLPRADGADPFAHLIGAYDGDPGDVDEVVYGPRD